MDKIGRMVARSVPPVGRQIHDGRNGMKFLTTKKWLTDYALSCGYMEVTKGYTTPGCPIYVSLSKEHGAYKVAFIDRCMSGYNSVEWFRTLPAARKAFTENCRRGGLSRKIPEAV